MLHSVEQFRFRPCVRSHGLAACVIKAVLTLTNMRVRQLSVCQCDLSECDANPCSGFSVDSAKGVMQHSELTFIAGAPRANHTGAVVLLKKDSAYRLVPEFILWGEELASSFGYSVSVTDLNQDG